MRMNEKHWGSHNNRDIFGVNLHRFIELEESSGHMEIAQELGISLGEVKALKKKINRT
ncbi:hypothetical protein [Ornithinibacillus halotolerans]|uniref:RNA polymerase subunit sigma-70 n=1 Tax=Ornithinibacillus halotolerans TaxID=1274357 RepID=A0A916RTN4_9BACI|nr:hypothetical protein [Ornithinibacillus halotolerans]GGA69181.1 hypothetical protein GCM10008025_11440 [Ornithinibacillus halotolerans]